MLVRCTCRISLQLSNCATWVVRPGGWCDVIMMCPRTCLTSSRAGEVCSFQVRCLLRAGRLSRRERLASPQTTQLWPSECRKLSALIPRSSGGGLSQLYNDGWIELNQETGLSPSLNVLFLMRCTTHHMSMVTTILLASFLAVGTVYTL